MDEEALTRYINIASFILWISLLEKVFMDDSANLKFTCILLILYILINTAKDIWDSKSVKCND
ncbi:hypothetical protein [Clostridium beijerinckii]|uniref:hypothetical protein n=1 Tax=Clostridium beijerinckii TaxID=1520 RepID=UPI00098C1AC0|nr:hypothetical protein [Clostridium beijerinckii]NRT78134.1 hypothetical protein [Clostridium beijerinckii]OOM44786.1 hypothetical protein CBEIJ_35320 [Clostridium beijerinckii]